MQRSLLFVAVLCVRAASYGESVFAPGPPAPPCPGVKDQVEQEISTTEEYRWAATAELEHSVESLLQFGGVLVILALCLHAPPFHQRACAWLNGEKYRRRLSTGNIPEEYRHDKNVATVDEIPDPFRTKKYLAADVPTVGIGIKVLSLSDFNMAAGTFSADFNINVAWIGKRETGPEIQFYNMVNHTVLEKAAAKEQKDGQGHDGETNWEFYYRVRVQGTFRQQYNLKLFPFDTQDLQVDVRLKSPCRLKPLRWGVGGEPYTYDLRCVSDEFTLVDAGVRHMYLPSYKFGKLDGYDPEATIHFGVRRKPTFWVVSYGVITSLVCSLVCCTYAIPVTHNGERLGVAMTLVLTMLTTKYLMQEKLPSVSYFTAMDTHILLCSLFLMVLTLQIGFMGLLCPVFSSAQEKIWLPRVAGLWILYHIGISHWISNNGHM